MCLSLTAWANVKCYLPFGFALDPCGNIIRRKAYKQSTLFGWECIKRRQEPDKLYPLHWKAAARNRAVRNATPLNLQDDRHLRTGVQGVRVVARVFFTSLACFALWDFLGTNWFIDSILIAGGYKDAPAPKELPRDPLQVTRKVVIRG